MSFVNKLVGLVRTRHAKAASDDAKATQKLRAKLQTAQNEISWDCVRSGKIFFDWHFECCDCGETVRVTKINGNHPLGYLLCSCGHVWCEDCTSGDNIQVVPHGMTLQSAIPDEKMSFTSPFGYVCASCGLSWKVGCVHNTNGRPVYEFMYKSCICGARKEINKPWLRFRVKAAPAVDWETPIEVANRITPLPSSVEQEKLQSQKAKDTKEKEHVWGNADDAVHNMPVLATREGIIHMSGLAQNGYNVAWAETVQRLRIPTH